GHAANRFARAGQAGQHGRAHRPARVGVARARHAHRRDRQPRRRAGRRVAGHVETAAAPHEVRAAVVHEAARGPPRGHGAGQPRVVPITQVPAVVRDAIFEWRNARAADLLFTHRDDSIIAMVVLIGLALMVIVVRTLTRKKAGRTQVALPAVLVWSGGSWTS